MKKMYELSETMFSKYEGESEYSLSSHSTELFNPFNPDFEVEEVFNEFNRKSNYNYNLYTKYKGKIEVLKQNSMEFVFKYVEESGYSKIYILKIIETEIDV